MAQGCLVPDWADVRLPIHHHRVPQRRPQIRARSSASDQRFAEAKRNYTYPQYDSQTQSQGRADWAASVRSVTGSRHHQFWEPQLSPPALLAQVSVVLMSPRRPISVGTVARACSCFEVEDVRVVQPRCDYITRHSKSASKGAQYILHRAQMFDSIRAATEDCDLRVAFTRWVQGCPLPYLDLPALPHHPLLSQVINAPVSTPEGQPPGSAPPRIALVFGREELGLSDQEVQDCDVVCSIPIGRLQESLSLSHAVTLACSTIFQHRLAHVAPVRASQDAQEDVVLPGSSGAGRTAAYRVNSPDHLAPGFDKSEGTER